MSVLIKAITPGSYADKCGVKPNERLISINGNEIVDVLDYRFYQINRTLNIVVAAPNGDLRELRIVKREYDEIGFEFEDYLMDKEHSCRNKCIFCFIDQLPKGMRRDLYFKDDDSRLSFLFGNYITLTNITEHEIERIIKMHISPINVSVHTTNPELRVKMMKNPNSGKALGILKRFAQGGIKLNCQIVACPGINDGEELEHTLDDLLELTPSVECISVVPLGMTRYREKLYPLTGYTKETAGQTIDIIERYGDMCMEKYGERIAYASDEFYLKAEREIPNADFYGEFDSLEDGVGMAALLKDEFRAALECMEDDFIPADGRHVTIACGEAIYEFLRDTVMEVCEKYPGVKIDVVPIKNNFFGGEINVSGLITGGDLIEQLRGRNLGQALLITTAMLRHDGDLFLDDKSVDDVENALKVRLIPVENDGFKLLDAILDRKENE